MFNVALPKGRLAEKTLKLFDKIGIETEMVQKETRQLIIKDEKNGINYFMVKPSDVAIYVEYGVADIGVVGKDILLEYKPDVYELLDLNMGKCRMAVAGKKNFCDDVARPLRVATKFVNIAREYYDSVGREIEVIKLNGSIELAPILNMSDVIVDIVETGTTLKENDLEVLQTIVPISARLIANKSSFKFKNAEICNLKNKLQGVQDENF